MSGIALVLQCIPAVILLTSRDVWLRPIWVRAAALCLVAVPPVTEEVWLQTATAQFHVALACALVLALDVPRRGIGRLPLLSLAPLCGPPSIALLPVFLLRSLVDRSRGRAAQAAALFAGAAVQMAAFYSTSGRPHGIGPVVLLCVVYVKQVVAPLMGRHVAEEVSTSLRALLERGEMPWTAIAATIGTAGLAVVVSARSGLPAALWLFLASGVTAFLAYYGAIDGGTRLMIVGNEGRYSFLPEVLTALALLGAAASSRGVERWATRALVLWLIAVGLVDMGRTSPFMGTGPDWLGEGRAWRADPAHPIAIWPRGWTMTLSR